VKGKRWTFYVFVVNDTPNKNRKYSRNNLEVPKIMFIFASVLPFIKNIGTQNILVN
jgi:hypothetical protein